VTGHARPRSQKAPQKHFIDAASKTHTVINFDHRYASVESPAQLRVQIDIDHTRP
jgi:hypothetical protein